MEKIIFPIGGGFFAKVERSPEVDSKVVDYLVEELKRYGCGCPEGVADSEDLQCEGASILSEMAEILKLDYMEDGKQG